MNSFGDKIVFAQIKDGRDQLIALNGALKQEFKAAGFDCEDRYTPHVTVLKVRWKKILASFSSLVSRLVERQNKEFLKRLSISLWITILASRLGNIEHTAHSYLKLFTKQCTMVNNMHTASFQEIQGIRLLSLHKPATPEGHNFCEGEFLFQELTGDKPPSSIRVMLVSFSLFFFCFLSSRTK